VGLVVLRKPRARASDAYRQLRTRLGHLQDELQVVALAAAEEGEGASTAIANLAVCTAQLGYHVLLIDGDMRRPTLHHVFGRPNCRGLSHVLAGDCSLSRALERGPVDTLSLLFAGPTPDSPADQLASPRMGALLSALRDLYDLVLIDLPSVLAAPDASILASRTDGLVLVVGMGLATPESARLAVEHLEASHGQLLGMLLNGLSIEPILDEHDPTPTDPSDAPPAVLVRVPKPRPS
jgi:capsular exopolysaccharide synthesis family protein